MIPITRKDLYLNKIVGNDDYSVPEKPISEEEFFFAEILGEAVQAPEPLTRYQLYLAKIAGRDVEIPYPETRLEYFLARAAGMNVETPAPITREEIYWSNYTATTEFELEGVPPLTYKTIKGTLKNYCIFGNSVEQVISNNLFYKVISGAGMQTDGTIKSDSSYNMLFAKIIPGQDYIAAKGEVNSTALTYTLYNVYDHDPNIGSQALLPSWKSTNNNGIINYTGDTPVYLGLRVPASTAFPHLNIGTTIYDYDEYEASITGVGDRTANLFANLWKKGYIRADNGREEQIDGFICSGFFPVEHGQTYSISRNINVGYDNVRGYRDNGSFIGAGTDICDVSNPIPSAATNIGTFTVTNENVAFIRFNDSANDLGMKYMIVKGTYTKQTMPDYEPYGYRVPVRVTDGNDTVKTNIYLPEQIKMVGDEAEYVDFEEQKQHRVRKNLLQNTATSQTINGVTFTVNADGSVICNGTSTSQYYSLFRIPCYLVAGNYTISGCPVGGSSRKYRADIRISPNGGMVGADADIGAGATIPIDESGWYDYTIRIQGGYPVDDVTFKPMIRKADIEDNTYEPYIENTELDVTLPALPTLAGTNVLSVGTEVQPSKVYIKGEKRRD